MFYKAIFLFFLLFEISCNNSANNNEYKLPIPSNLSGKELAQTYCASCHEFPVPNLLDKKSWQNRVLPKMYARLGLEQDNFALFASMDIAEMKVIMNAGIYPDRPIIAKEDWAKIVKYYIENAPEEPLIQARKTKVSANLKGFETQKLFARENSKPATTMVKFSASDKSIYVGYRSSSNYLKKYDLKLQMIDSTHIPSPIADMQIPQKQLLLMGLMDPNDQKMGSLYAANSKNILIDSLQRPVNIEMADLNNDGINDYLICNFGNELGKLAWYDGKTKKEKVLNANPGARKTQVKDMNGDGKPDIVALMTQAKEQLIIYFNKGNGLFNEETKLNFPSVYGSSYFEMADFNKDGFLDILYTNGDNADLSPILKNYHGVRIYQNDGKNNFKQTYFYPMYGASKAMAADFDLDGDLDIAAISFFTNPKQIPNEGFLMFNNLGDNKNFYISSPPIAGHGNWMIMDLADMDQDGDSDIILGSFMKKGLSNFKYNNEKAVEIVLFKNTKKR